MSKGSIRGKVAVGLLVCAVCSFPSSTTVQAQSKASAKSVESLNSMIKALTKVQEQVKGAMGSLTALTSGDQANLSKNYKDFSKRVDGMSKAAEDAKGRAADMKERREAYLQEFQAKMEKISDPEIKAHMTERKEEVRKTFESSQDAGQAIKDAFPPFMTNLKDIQQMLSVDLSASGVAAAAPIGQKATANGTTITSNLDALITKLTEIKNQVAPPK